MGLHDRDYCKENYDRNNNGKGKISLWLVFFVFILLYLVVKILDWF